MARKISQKPEHTKEYVIETIEFKIEYYKDLLTQFGDHKYLWGMTKEQYCQSIKELEELLIQIDSNKYLEKF